MRIDASRPQGSRPVITNHPAARLLSAAVHQSVSSVQQSSGSPEPEAIGKKRKRDYEREDQRSNQPSETANVEEFQPNKPELIQKDDVQFTVTMKGIKTLITDDEVCGTVYT